MRPSLGRFDRFIILFRSIHTGCSLDCWRWHLEATTLRGPGRHDLRALYGFSEAKEAGCSLKDMYNSCVLAVDQGSWSRVLQILPSPAPAGHVQHFV